MYGFYRVASAVPEVRVADIEFNQTRILEQIKEADSRSASAVVFPELAITGYTCGDLFHQPLLVEQAIEAVCAIAKETSKLKIVSIIGTPFYYKNGLYNCAFVVQAGEIKGIVPKCYPPNYREFYEKRWFSPGRDLPIGLTVQIGSRSFPKTEIPFGTDIIFEGSRYFKIGVEICEDLWAVIPPSSYHSISGALLSFNLSASNELVSKADYRRELVKQQSGRCISAYIYASSGVHESTTDLVFGGHSMIVENGSLLAENERFQRENHITFADIDCKRLFSARLGESSFNDCRMSLFGHSPQYRTVTLGKLNRLEKLERYIDAHPFVPSLPELRNERCKEIYSIQSAGLAKRFEHTGLDKAVIGISGGLDSTLALLIVVETFKLLNKPMSGIQAITMPGFGTTGRTYKNAVELCNILGVTLREIDIQKACMDHFEEIGHDPEIHDVTYENVQARERTQVLMDIANRESGLVIGTGDLSEMALGWSTYNGDHMSMYAVNCSVPKTLIRYIIQWEADCSGDPLKSILEDIIATPVSPELLPKKHDDEIHHKTEELIGPYELHDFFIYHLMKYGAEPEKIRFLAKHAFGEKYSEEDITKFLKLFIKRFFSQQFKRSCTPDGPKVGTISLSPRGDWRMPSDASFKNWMV